MIEDLTNQVKVDATQFGGMMANVANLQTDIKDIKSELQTRFTAIDMKLSNNFPTRREFEETNKDNLLKFRDLNDTTKQQVSDIKEELKSWKRAGWIIISAVLIQIVVTVFFAATKIIALR